MTEDRLVAHALQLVASSQVAEGVSVATQAAEQGDVHAAMQLAVWNLIGQPIARDLPIARHWLRRAAELGHVDGALMEVALTANGSGAPADWPAALALLHQAASNDPIAAEQLALLNQMDLDGDGLPRTSAKAERLSDAPEIIRFPRLFSPAECAHIAKTAHGLMEPSSVLDPATGRRIAHPIRTSDDATIGPTHENLVVQALNRRLAAASGTGVGQGESLTVLRYGNGQQYRLHLDTIAGATNQRIKTALVYLNEGYGGGETTFPTLGITVRPRGGDCIVFTNVLPDGRPDQRARHAGQPVTAGSKWLATRWIRAAPISPWQTA